MDTDFNDIVPLYSDDKMINESLLNYSFNLSENFLDKYKNVNVKWGALGYIVYKRSYARIKENGLYEEWWETVKRIVETVYTIQKWYIHEGTGSVWNEWKAQKSAQEMYDRMFNFKFLPAGRGIFGMDKNLLAKKGSALLFNCAAVSTENIDYDFAMPFCWAMMMSFLGVGVGFDVKGALKNKKLIYPKISDKVFVVRDSKEGWVSALDVLLRAYSQKNVYLPSEFDFSQIRPRGSLIKTFGGIAPGYEPLKKLLDRVRGYLDDYLKKDKTVDSTLIVDIMTAIGEAVVSGGVRRSAMLALGNINDKEFLNLKNYKEFGDIIGDKPRWASNNSIIANIGEDYSPIIDNIIQNGEPGLIFLQNAKEYSRTKDSKDYKDMGIELVNPCGEIGLESFGLCNLVEIFLPYIENIEDFKRTIKYAYLYGKTVTLLKTHSKVTNGVIMNTRRIGIGVSGVVQAIDKFGYRNLMNMLDIGYNEINYYDKVYSSWFGIPLSIKKTTVKPSGSVSLLTGVTPGVHFPHSKYYYRTIRIQKTSPILNILVDAGYKVEDAIGEEQYTSVVYFPIKETLFYKSKKEVTLWEQLALVNDLQRYWSDNLVSVTVTFDPQKEGRDIKRAIEMYEDKLKGVSFLPLEGHNYKQAPYQEITEEEYNSAISNLKDFSLKDISWNINIEQKEQLFCDTDKCLTFLAVDQNEINNLLDDNKNI